MQLRTKLTCGIFKLVTGQHQSLVNTGQHQSLVNTGQHQSLVNTSHSPY